MPTETDYEPSLGAYGAYTRHGGIDVEKLLFNEYLVPSEWPNINKYMPFKW